jgi:hypothetical protein
MGGESVTILRGPADEVNSSKWSPYKNELGTRGPRATIGSAYAYPDHGTDLGTPARDVCSVS